MLCILLLIDVLILIVAIETFAILNHRKLKALDNKIIAVNDFTIFIKNLPLDTDSHHLKEFIIEKFSGIETKIEKIYYLFDFTEYENLYEQKKRR